MSKKIMFNDKYGLTQAVLYGRKTMTRRIFYIPDKLVPYLDIDDIFDIVDDCIIWKDKSDNFRMTFEPKYKVGEVVAIAQSYSDCGNMPDYGLDEDCYPIMPKRSGFFNKMFVKADLMPHHIEITGIKVERLQDISDEDCLKEGIIRYTKDETVYKYDLSDGFEMLGWGNMKRNPKDAFACLIDKVSGKGVWESNPFVFVYEFKLID